MSSIQGVSAEDIIDLDKRSARIVRRRSLRLLGIVLSPQRFTVAGLMVLVVVAQVAKAAGPALIAVTVNLALPALGGGDPTLVFVFGGLYLLSALAAGGLGWASIVSTSVVSQNALLSLRRRTFEHVQRLSLGFHERYTSGRAIARQTSDLDAIRELLDSGINQLLSSVVFMSVVAVLITTLDPMSGAVLLVAGIPAFALTRWFHVRSQVHYRATRVASAGLIVQFVETMTGIRAIQAFRRETLAAADHERLSEEYAAVDAKATGLTGVYDPSLILIGNLTVAAVLLIDGYRVLNGELPLGTLIAAVLYAQQFFGPLDQMARFYNSFQAAIASLEKISGLLDERPGLEERPHPRRMTEVRGQIVFDDVSFSYVDGRPIIPCLDLAIEPGQTVALVGTTGAGKSTVAKLIARFYDASGGVVRIDGVDVRDLAFVDLRRHVVVVTQEPFLFSGTIADNIAIGKPDASRAEIEAAARVIGADRFISALPDGYDTEVNKRGGRLSAGQRQLVSFARAFIADPTVLILDEATSSLDLASEATVQQALGILLRGRTAVIIAHRLSTVDIADRVLVLRDGQVIEDGAPDVLATADGEFARLRSSL